MGKAEQDFLTIGICAVAISIIGLIDDIYNLEWRAKLVAQTVIIIYPLVDLEIFINVESFLGLEMNNYLNLFISLFWILVIINSINFIDNMDGLTVIVSGSICLQVALLANYSDIYKVTDVSLLLLATLIGFLFYNFPPAKLYFGDSGTLFVGYVLGFISIIFDWNPSQEVILLSPLSPALFIFVVPILDFAVVTTDRIKNKKSPTTGGTDHISHRFLAAGFSEKKVLTTFLLYAILLFTLILVSIISSKFIAYAMIIIFLVLFVFTFLKISKMKILE